MATDHSQSDLFDPSTDEAVGSVERRCRARNLDWVVGTDEAGRGPLAGPVYAAAVAVPTDALDAPWLEGLDDSKELTDERRAEAFEAIRAGAEHWQIESVDAAEIDASDILRAACRAMANAARGVLQSLTEESVSVVVDGTSELPLEHRHRSLAGADGRSLAVAAASILAKVDRDRAMIDRHQEWPVYNFASNKGYPTGEHRRALDRHGPCPIHRRSFAGVDPTDGGGNGRDATGRAEDARGDEATRDVK